MRTSGKATFVVLGALIVVGVVTLKFTSNDNPETGPRKQPTETESSRPQATVAAAREKQPQQVAFKTVKRAKIRDKFSELRAYSSEINPQLLSMESFVQRMASAHPELNLTNSETAVLVSLCADMAEVIGRLKAEDAKVVRDTEDIIEVTVAANFDDSAYISDIFAEELGVRLTSADRALEIDHAMAKDLFHQFHGYRGADEKYTFTRSTIDSSMYAFHYEAEFSEQFRNSPQNLMDRKTLGTGTSYPVISLQSVINFPEYGWLETVLNPKNRTIATSGP